MTAPKSVFTVRDEFAAHWPLLLAASMGVGLSSLHTYSIGVFIGPIGHEFGWHTEKIILGLGLVSIMTGIGSPICGHFMDRLGARTLGLAGTIVIALGTGAIGLIPNSLPAFLACFTLVGIGTVMASPMVWQRNVVERFIKARGLAVSVALCGSNVAGAIAPILATLVAEKYNWRAAYFVLAGYMLLSTLPLAWLFFRDATPGEQTSQITIQPTLVIAITGMSTTEACKTREFWLITIAFMFAGIGIAGYIVHLVPMLTAQGLPLLLAASVVSLLSVAAICGRLAAGALMDHMFAPRLAALTLGLPVIGSLAILTAAPSYGIGLLAAISIGLSTGAEFNMISYLTVQYFGIKNFGVIGGLVFGAFMLGCLGGQILPPLILHHGNYHNVIIMLMMSFVLSSFLLFFCRPYFITQRRFETST